MEIKKEYPKPVNPPPSKVIIELTLSEAEDLQQIADYYAEQSYGNVLPRACHQTEQMSTKLSAELPRSKNVKQFIKL